MITILVMNKLIKTNKMEKEKLTIKPLVPYLAYDIEFVLSELGIFNLDSEHGTPYQALQPMKITNILFGEEIEIEIHSEKNNWGVGYIGLDEVKPLLYPMEYLTKEITHNGEKFIPIDKLVEIFDDDYEIDIRYLKQWSNHGNVYFGSLAYDFVIKLHEWGFAVNIPKHLYINKAEI